MLFSSFLLLFFGLVDQPLAWLKSFLFDRSNCVVLGQSRSSWVPSPFGVPRGSVLGPLLYLLLQTLVFFFHSWGCSISYLPMVMRLILTLTCGLRNCPNPDESVF